MGQPIAVVEKPSVSNRGIVRFETNRALTGMGHEHYSLDEEVRGDRPPDELARRLLARDNVHGVHINGSVVTVDLAKGHTSEGLKQIIEDLYIFYPETDEDEVEADADAPTSDAELADQVVPDADAAPEPVHEPAVPADEAAVEAAAVDAAATPDPEADAGEVPAEDAAPSADDVVGADETSEVEVQADEGDAPTLDQAPVSEEPAAEA